jgi:hypothetical protein
MTNSSDRAAIDAAKAELVQRKAERLASIGQPIPGSHLLRDYCVSCGEAIRVTDASRPNVCLSCQPSGVPGKSRGKTTRCDSAYHGGQFSKAEW